MIGLVIADRYRIQECLGTGTMGAVYRAEHIHMKKAVAIKILHPSHVRDPEVVERFQREAQAAANIDHPNICAATDFGRVDEDLYFLVMELLDGKPLIDAINDGEPFSVERVLHLALQMCDALERAHDKGVVHRDLKPENVLLVERDGDPDVIKITDFGVAKVRMFKDAARLTQVGVVYGSPLYMAPEQAAGKEIDHRADLYSLGIMLYELLVGALPFYTSNLSLLLNMHIADEPPAFSEKNPEAKVDPELEAIVQRLLAKDPDDRFQSAGELREALAAVHRRLFGPPASSWSGEGSRRKRVVVVVVGALLVLGLVAFAIIADRRDAAARRDAADARAKAAALASVDELSAEREQWAMEPEAQRAVALIETNPEGAVAELGALQARAPKNPHVHFFLGRALVEQDAWERAFGAYASAIDLEPKYARDIRLLDDVMTRFEDYHRDDAQGAAAFLREHVGDVATPRLAELAEHHKVRRVRKRALAFLEESGAFEELPLWNQLTIRLRHAVGCEANKELVIEIGQHGDPRALAALRRFSALPKIGCGEDESEDCYACLREDLRAAIEALQSAQLNGPD